MPKKMDRMNKQCASFCMKGKWAAVMGQGWADL